MSAKERAKKAAARARRFKRRLARGSPQFKTGNYIRPNLAPMGELPDTVIFQLSFSPQGVALLGQNVKYFSKTNITRLVRYGIYYPLRTYIKTQWLRKETPIDSGELLKSLESSLYPRGGSKTEIIDARNPFIVILNSRGVVYGNTVNSMPSHWLTHPLPKYTDSGYLRNQRSKSGGKLHDPTAKSGFFDTAVLNGRLYAAALYDKFINDEIQPIISVYMKNIGLSGNSRQMSEDMFHVRYM